MILRSSGGDGEIREAPEIRRSGWVELKILCGSGPDIGIESKGGIIDVARGISRKFDSGYGAENSAAENGVRSQLTDVPVPAGQETNRAANWVDGAAASLE